MTQEGWASVFHAAAAKFAHTPKLGDGLLLAPAGQLSYATLALGSAQLAHLGWHTTLSVYAGLLALAVNLAIAAAGTIACRTLGVSAGVDSTDPDDYIADEDDSTIKRMAELVDGLPRYRGKHAR